VSSHSEVLEAIPAYLSGRLEPDAARAVDAHTDACASCAATLDECRGLLATMRAGGRVLFEPHPDEQRLRAQALGNSAGDDPAIARHLAACPSCQIEVVAWKRREEALAVGRGAAAGRRGAGAVWRDGAVWRVAALLVVGVAVGAALDRLLLTPPPATVQDRVAPQPPATTSAVLDGPVPLVILRGTVRGTDAPPVVHVEPGSPTILLAVPPPLPRQAAGTDRYRFAITGPGTGVRWSTELSADDIRRLRGAGEVVVFAVPAAALGEGRHEIRMTGPLDGGPEPIVHMQSAFEVVRPGQRQSPAATNAPQ